MKIIFKPKCPNCRTNYKTVKRCSECYKLVCNLCSIELLCIDCYTTSSQDKESKIYFEEKYFEKVIA